MDRLNANDLSMLWPDEVGWPQDIGALSILAGGPLLDVNGRVQVDLVRAAVQARLHLVPRFRQLLYLPRRGLGGPLWVDAPHFDLADHVQVHTLPAPGTQAQLLATVEQLRRRPFDRSMPLWEMWLLPGLPGDQIGMYIKVHHTIADGAAGVATLGALLDALPDPAPSAAPLWTPAPVPSARELLRDNLLRRRDGALSAFSALARPGQTMRRAREAWPALRETLGGEQASQTSLNRRIGPDRRLSLIGSDLHLAKLVAHGSNATVNDVLIAAIAGGLRDLLNSRGEHVDGLVLRAYVPVSLHGQQHGPARGNLDGMMAVSLPIGVPDPVQRLRLIAAETTVRKKRRRVPAGTLMRNRFIQRSLLPLLARQRFANVYVANVPGPPMPLYLAGAQLLMLFPIVPLIGNMTLGVGALSYAGQFNITVVADRDACSDVAVFADGVRDALQSLAVSVSIMSTAAAHREPSSAAHQTMHPEELACRSSTESRCPMTSSR
jgi:diacylglycerol O-acyltransferase / wax synthase